MADEPVPREWRASQEEQRDAIRGMRWDDFRRWFRDRWEPGQHIALVGPTGTGKSTFACHVIGPDVANRFYVLALDPKGGDSTLASSGLFVRIPTWPPGKKLREAIEDGAIPVRLVVGPVVHTLADRAALVAAQREALQGAFEEGGWTIYIDELQLATDRRIMDLGREVEQILVAARDKGISLVSSYQAPRWVPPSASQQATWVAMWRTMDRRVVDRMAEVLGRDAVVLRRAVLELGDHDVLIGGRNLRDPLIVTDPPPIEPKLLTEVDGQ
ncbi:MAG: hypothetical protein ACYCV4_05510 [Dermatophilaceae bacterium]